jgi:large subunit ribosomal protein L35Ae
MEAKIVGFKRSRRNTNNKYCIIESDGAPASLIGKTIRWQSQSGRLLFGSVIRTHGSRMALARFSRGLPGTAIGDKVFVGPMAKPKVVKKRPGIRKKIEPKAVKKAAKPPKEKAKKKKKPVKAAKKSAAKPKERTKKKTPTKKATPRSKAKSSKRK